MAKNRLIPFGYYMSDGDLLIETKEAEIVQYIFNKYTSGASLQIIADDLSKRGFRYSNDKDYWNKMMIQRILENRRYVGDKGWPAIVDSTLFEQANAVKMASPHSRKFRQNKSRHIIQERSIGVYSPTSKIRRMTNEINRALEKSPDPEIVRPMIFACAAEKYNSLGECDNG